MKALRLALAFGTGGVGWTPAIDPATAARAGGLLVVVGFALGLLCAQLFSITWGLFGELQGLRIMPVLAVVLLSAGWLDARLFLGLAEAAETLVGQRPRRADLHRPAPLGPAGSLALLLGVLVLFAGLLAAPPPPPYVWFDDWRQYFMWTYPPMILRVVACLSLWGRFGVLLAACIGPPGRHADPWTTQLCRSVRLPTVLLAAILPVGLTTYWFSTWPGKLYGLPIALATFAVVYVVNVLMVRRLLGHLRCTLLASGAVAMLSFLVLYLSVAQPMVW